MPAVEGWSGIIFDGELNRPRHIRSRDLGRDAQAKVDAGAHSARCEDISVAHDAAFLVRRTDKRQKVDIGPMRACPPSPKQACSAEQECTHTNRRWIGGPAALAANEFDGLCVIESAHHAATAGYADEIEVGTRL